MVLYPLMAFAISLSLTAFCIRILPKLGFIDAPGGRHIHVRAVPRGGGVAVVLAVFLTILAYAAASRDELGIRILKTGTLPGVVILLTGLIDDRVGLRSIVKLFAQICAAVLIWYSFDRQLAVCGWMFPQWLSLAVTVLWVVGVINAFNMVDGLDGLAAGLASISAGCLSVWFIFRGSPMALYTLIFAGACLGFLRYNFAPARIFLGDTGSMFLGMFLAVAGAGTLDYTATFTSLLLPPLIIGVPIFDMFLAVWRRSVRKVLNPEGAGLMDADSDHLHHRLLRRSGSHSKAAARMYILSAFFALLAIVLLLMRDRAVAAAFILLVLTGLVILRNLAVVEIYDSVVFLRKSFLRMRKNLLFVAVHPLVDMIMTGCAAAVFSFVVLQRFSWKYILYSVFPVMVVLVVCGTYRVFWLRAVMRDRAKLFLVSVAGSTLSVVLLWIYKTYERGCAVGNEFYSGAVLFILLTASLISFERFLLHYIESAWINLFVSQCVSGKNDRILLVGSGFFMRIAMMYFYCSRSENMTNKIVGTVSDDSEVSPGERCYGVPVLGRSGDLEKIFQQNLFDRIVIAAGDIPEKVMQRIAGFCAAKQIRCTGLSMPDDGLNPVDGIRLRGGELLRIPWFVIDVVSVLFISAVSSFLALHFFSPVYVVSGVVLTLAVSGFCGCYKVRWQMANIDDRWQLLKWSFISGSAVQLMLAVYFIYIYAEKVDIVHFLTGAAVYMLLLCGSVQLFRLFVHPTVYHALRKDNSSCSGRDIVLGGGLHCRIYLQSLAADRSECKRSVAGIIDDDAVFHGLKCLGFPVLGGSDDLDTIRERVHFDRIVVTGERVSDENMQKIDDFCARSGVKKVLFCVGEQECRFGQSDKKA